jgi:hypothetical protein
VSLQIFETRDETPEYQKENAKNSFCESSFPLHSTPKTEKVVHEQKKKRRFRACARHSGRRRRI